MIIVTGDAYRARETLKALGGRWDRDRRVWVLPDGAEGAVKSLLDRCGVRLGYRYVPDREGEG